MGEGKLRAYLDQTCSDEVAGLFRASDRWDTMRAEDFGAGSASPKEQLNNAENLKRMLVTGDASVLEEEAFPIRECPTGVIVFEAAPGDLGTLEAFLDEVFGKLDYYYRRLKIHCLSAGFRASTVPREGKPKAEFRKW